MELGCAVCGENRRTNFSKNQLSKASQRRCHACVAAAPPAPGRHTPPADKGRGATRQHERRTKPAAVATSAQSTETEARFEGAIVVDGASMEGGGQVVRLSCSLAGLLGTRLHLHSIRAKRSKPGLARQHLTGLRLAAEMCGESKDGTVVLYGAEVGACEILFAPPPPCSLRHQHKSNEDTSSKSPQSAQSEFRANTGGAGSLMLVLQIALPIALFCDGGKTVSMYLEGGTNASMAPPVDFFVGVLAPLLVEHCGLVLHIETERRGYFPEGGGVLSVSVDRTKFMQGKALKPVLLGGHRGRVVSIRGIACVGGKVSAREAEEMVSAATAVLRQRLQRAELAAVAAVSAAFGEAAKLQAPAASDEPPSIEISLDVDSRTFSSGGGLTLWAVTESGSRIGGSALLELPRTVAKTKRHRAGGTDECVGAGLGKVVGEAAAEDLIAQLSHGGAVDEHCCDQLVVFMALAEGESQVLAGPLSLHTQTALHFASELAHCKIKVDDLDGTGLNSGLNMITCEGIRHTRTPS